MQEVIKVQVGKRYQAEIQGVDILFKPRRMMQGYREGDIVQSPAGTGWLYRAQTSGLSSGDVLPKALWPTTAGLTVNDGSVVWEAIALDDLRLPSVSHSWTSVDSLTVVDGGAGAAFDYRATISGFRLGYFERVLLTLTYDGRTKLIPLGFVVEA